MSTSSNTTENVTDRGGQSSGTVAPTSKRVSYGPHISRPRVNNVTLYVVPYDDFNGRLGNQMFMYASILGIARAQGRGIFYHPKTKLADTFKITNGGVDEHSKRWPVIREAKVFDEKMFNLPMQNVRIKGFLQSPRYFTAVNDEVRQEFTFHDSIANDAANILRKVRIEHNSSLIVGVHVRRTDFLQRHFQRLGYAVPDKSYFTKAFSLMKSKFPGRQITFLVASDDIPWCSKNLFSSDVSIMPSASDSVHLATLSSCDHVIISGGSYGWWSGWLANGYVIYYTGYMRSGTPLGNWYIQDQYYPRLWIGLGN